MTTSIVNKDSSHFGLLTHIKKGSQKIGNFLKVRDKSFDDLLLLKSVANI